MGRGRILHKSTGEGVGGCGMGDLLAASYDSPHVLIGRAFLPGYIFNEEPHKLIPLKLWKSEALPSQLLRIWGELLS